MIVQVRNSLPEFKGYATERTRGLYNVDAEDGRRFEMDVDVPLGRDDWQVGVVVGPSGSGKTSVARELTREKWVNADIVTSGMWSDAPIIEDLTEQAGDYAKATAALAAVGLGSVPSWLRPHGALSNGEQFRANLAALLIWTQTRTKSVFIDEFTSVLDRQVAKVGAAAFVRQWRRREGRQVILITPHYDILDWVEPDWWIDTAEGADQFAQDRGVVQARKGSFQAAHAGTVNRGNPVGTVAC